MLVTFKSKAAADIIMYQEHAKRILDLLHKDVERGVITATETELAIAKLSQEIAESRARSAAEEASNASANRAHPDDSEREATRSVSFATRVYPFLEMLRAAHKRGCDVAWGI
jgi:hypothetical protein